MAYGEVTMARGAKHKKGKKVLDHMRIKEAENGGHTVEHHYNTVDGPGYHEPEMHVFGPDQGEEMLAHVAKHANVDVDAKEKELDKEAESEQEHEEED